MLVNTAIAVIGILIFLFIFWKRLKEDYAHEIIFKSALMILAGVILGGIVSWKILPLWFFWLELLGGTIGVVLAVTSLNVRFHETFESFVISSLPWLSLVFLGDSVVRSRFSSFLGFLITLIFMFVFYYLDSHYKKFTWYRSGKIGFAGLATAAVIFLARAGLAVFTDGVLSFVDKYEVAFSVIAASLCFLMIFNLGRITK